MFLECLTVLFAAIELVGVVGGDLRARAFFDVNNVKVGDPMVLTIDFLGEADFKSLHPPALSRAVDRKDWKLDDVSAKTDTYRDARRLTYRVRPMREGVLWFPALTFEYTGTDGVRRQVRANEIPVHSKVGAQVVVEEMGEDRNEMPKPPALVRELQASVSEDVTFAWKKALAKPGADAFAAFDFPEAKMNEATCAIRDGNWARAMKIYQTLEWRVGQTPEIERGIVAALAVRYENPAVELPVWRQVMRPILRYDWKGRIGLVVGGFGLLALVFWLLGRGIRAVACLATVLLVALPMAAETVETVVTNADGSVVHRKIVTGKNGGMSFSFSSTTSSGGALPSFSSGGRRRFGGGLFDMFDDFDPFGSRRHVRYPKVSIGVRLEPDRPSVVVGEDFNLILSLEHPRYVSLSEGLRVAIEEQANLQQTAPGRPLSPAASRNPTNVVQRIALPMRVETAFRGPLHFTVEGEYLFAGEHSFFSTPHAFSSGRQDAALTVRPFPEAGRPDDFGGIVSEGLRIHETCDILKVETNDVVTITYRMYPKGYVPADFLPRGAAFEWVRPPARDGHAAEIEYRRFFVANGEKATPKLSVSYFDPVKRAYRRAETGGTPLTYSAEAKP